MKRTSSPPDEGSVLLTTFLTVTVLTLICATSLLITSQNQVSGTQIGAWQGALTGAESGVDAAIRCLNTATWTNWVQMPESSNALPTSEPSPSSTTASGVPDSFHYNLLPSSSLTISYPTTEGATSVRAWVTIDQGGMSASQDTNGNQWYRIRSTGYSALNSPSLISSNNRLDSDLRNTITLRINRKTASTTNLGPSRSIEVIVQPIGSGQFIRGITSKGNVSLSGSMIIDSFNSKDYTKSDSTTVTYNGQTYTYGVYDSSKRQSHGDIGIVNSTNSNFNSTYVYGSVAYSGSTLQQATNVQGTISTPGPTAASITSVNAPTWTPTATYAGGGNPNSGTITAGPGGGSATLIKINGDINLSGSNVLHLAQADTLSNDQIIIWVTGKLATSGSSYISQDPNVKATWYVGSDIQLSGSSYENGAGVASNVVIYGYGTNNNQVQISGTASFVGAIDAPTYATQISGGGSFIGALITNTLQMSGGSSFHYDQALNSGGSAAVGNYSFASWFEDNAVANHKNRDGNLVIY